MSFEEQEFKNEGELESWIISHPDDLEKGFTVLDHQVKAKGGRIDILGVDKGRALTVVELKTYEDDDALLQGLDYVNWVVENISNLIKFYGSKSEEINAEETVRLILVAPSFSERLVATSRFLRDDVCRLSLMEYVFGQTKKKERILLCWEKDVPPIEIFAEPYTVDDYIEYVSEPEANEALRFVIERIKGLNDKIELKATQAWYAGFQF